MSAVMTPADSGSARRLTYVGFALIVLAFAVPPVAAALGLGTAFTVGEDIVRTLGSLALCGGITWLVTRGRSELAKAKGRVVIGVLLCITVGSSVYSKQKEEDIARQFMRDAIAFQQAQSAKFANLGERFDKVALNTILTPENMTTTAGMAMARATAAQYRALLAERKLLLQTYLAEFERFVSSLPAGDTQRGAMSSMGGSKEATERMYNDLDRTQTALIDAVSAVLDWGQGQAGNLGVRNGQLLFASQAQQGELQGLLAKVGAAEQEMNNVLKSTATAQAQAQEKMRTNIQEAERLLQKK